MPNWCSNKLTITGPKDEIAAVRKLIATSGDFDSAADSAATKARKMMLAGVMGVLMPTRASSFDSLPRVVAKIGKNTPANQAFDEFLELLGTDPDLTGDVQKQVESLYQRSGINNIPWGHISRTQRRVGQAYFNRVSFDWAKHWYDASNFWTSTVAAATPQPNEDETSLHNFIFTAAIPKSLLVEINGFNGRGLDSCPSGYEDSSTRFGTKWACGYDLFVEIDTPECLEVRFDTAWTPPEPVIAALAEMFPSLAINFTYIEEGCCFCGYMECSGGEVVDSCCEDIVYGDEPDEDECYDIVGPDYILGMSA